MPRIRVRPLRGKLTIDQALARLLRGSGYVAERVGPTAWRVQAAPTRPARIEQVTSSAPRVERREEIVVSATKRDLTLENAPMAATVVPVGREDRLNPGYATHRIAERTEGLALTGEGPGRNRIFLRGVADSPFGGKSQGTVAVLLDDARLTYVAPDPDIRLVDVDRVELLKGPQGSLYGSGALGGIYRIVINRADPSAFSVDGSVSVQSAVAGQTGAGATLVANVPLVADVAALRLVAYGEKAPGWIDTGARENSNGTSVAGARAGLGIEAGDGWRADLTGFGQWLHARDSNYLYQPEAHERPAQLPEPHRNDLVHGSFRLAHEGSVGVVLSSGYTIHDVDDRFDATLGAESFGLPDPQTLDDDSHYRLWDNELRVTGKWGRLSWLGGLSHVEAWQHTSRVLNGSGGAALDLETVARRESESALFGAMTLPLLKALDVTLGGRLSRTALHENRATATDEGIGERNRTRVAPSASLSWHPRKGRLLYLRYGSAIRQGGTTLDAAGEVRQLDEDRLMTLEGGWRETAGPLSMDLGLYHSWWNEIQSDVLLPSGLVETANVGDGAITGAELSVKAQFAGGWYFDAGAMAQSAMLTRDTSGLKLHDRRLPVVPSWTLRGAVTRDFALGDWDAAISAGGRYVGPARLSFDPALDRPMGNYLETNLDLKARRGPWTLAIEARNLFDARGDSFAYGNPLRIFSMRQYVRQEPRSASLTLTFAH